MTFGELELLKQEGEAPEWLTLEGLATLKGGYLLQGETPRGMYQRVANAAEDTLEREFPGKYVDISKKFFDLFWKNWLCLASPVAANLGTTRGLPISCFSNYIPDSVHGIMDAMLETCVMSKHGGGVGSHWADVRHRGSPITNNGSSDGVVPFLKILDSVTVGISQGGVRRGASAAYLPVTHGDFDEFLRIRRPEGDPNRQCLNIHHAASVNNEFMEAAIQGDPESRRKWSLILKTRLETGEPFLFFDDNVNNSVPPMYKDRGLRIRGSNICNEIYLYTDEEHSFVCCLSSMNLSRWDEWKDTDAVQLSLRFLDAVMSEFIHKSESIPGLHKARRFAVKSRALGLGVLGFHTLLQKKMISFGSFDAHMLNNQIFSHLWKETEVASRQMAEEMGTPEWCDSYGLRNTHRLALAPTVSNSLISGNNSPSIEPWAANAFTQKSAKGVFFQTNKVLSAILKELGKDDLQTWKSIDENEGSVQHLDFLSDEIRAVFRTAVEINQFDIIRLAAARQRWIDQGQSINLFFPKNVNPKYFHQVHLEAWKSGLKGLYYCRTSSVLKANAGLEYSRAQLDCEACEG